MDTVTYFRASFLRRLAFVAATLVSVNLSAQSVAGTGMQVASDRWGHTGDLVTARVEDAATRLLDGRVLVVGGYNGLGAASFLDSTEIHDQRIATWRATDRLHQARRLHFATRLLDGRVLVMGDTDPLSPDCSIGRYDPATELWAASGTSCHGGLQATWRTP